ncbi:MAG: S-adenosylmethionine:tRNA ribosyltransferase-isomerase [Bacteroidales bacterium]|nr:S-adenosylmethionine:tRNA ribosyltransferase-isomerase [Bacteroidales bacterium]
MLETPDFSLIDINSFNYALPDNRIAKFPMENRDESKLLVHHGNAIAEDIFKNVSSYLPVESLLIVNNTRVVRARLFFRKATGANIEIFCLEPLEPTCEIQMAFQQKGEAVWQCMVGNARRWKSEILQTELCVNAERIVLHAQKIKKNEGTYLVKFQWNQDLSFAQVLEALGKIPLPPYLHRDAIESDSQTYQTVYARFDGSVAAPTAGLHFTADVFESLKNKHIKLSDLTLHVGAGTFKPVGHEGLENHEMHTEQVLVSKALLHDILKYEGKITAVGTTSVRTLESLYWFGVKLAENPEAIFNISQFDPYQSDWNKDVTGTEAIRNILKYMEKKNLEILGGSTQLMIVPGYRFRVINGMITNFHQPRSTLLLLISAWLGDEWKSVYSYAMENDFRFLSYGDSCLFL